MYDIPMCTSFICAIASTCSLDHEETISFSVAAGEKMAMEKLATCCSLAFSFPS